MRNDGCVFCGSMNVSTKINFCWDCSKKNEEIEKQAEKEEKKEKSKKKHH